MTPDKHLKLTQEHETRLAVLEKILGVHLTDIDAPAADVEPIVPDAPVIDPRRRDNADSFKANYGRFGQ